MAKYVLRLFDDRLGTKTQAGLPAEKRVIYVVDGTATVSAGGASATLAANSAFFSNAETILTGGAEGAYILRYELVRVPETGHGMLTGENLSSELLLDAAMELEPGDGYLMRCDRVDLPPGGIAYTHTHQGGGIRCLLRGAFNVQTKGHTHQIAPGEPWFEAGPDPVLAWAPDDRPGHFSRVMILPRALKGKSSISYVNPEDAEKPKLQRYTIFVDELIAI
jgi:hypothetical protein